jgi:hypothetical protein
MRLCGGRQAHRVMTVRTEIGIDRPAAARAVLADIDTWPALNSFAVANAHVAVGETVEYKSMSLASLVSIKERACVRMEAPRVARI